ncbi:SPFH domain-containing protein [Labrys neptuniae]|uniref:SPFH domain-containing protein n=1 Tax=Labrys TaxID=204476 RepID=UPI00288CAB40|nr:SPFH domain-containing protein [Labrys neptuniae]MDT3378729.1 SPFH domain-containing protein [Labrys neptuniae]
MPDIPLTATTAVIVLAIVLLFFLMKMVKTVPQGYNYTVERFRRYAYTIQPGLNIVPPIFHRIGVRMNMMEQVLDVPTQEIITRDNASVAVDGVAFFQVIDAARAAYEVANLNSAILNLLMTNIRTVMGSMDLDQLLSHRDEINNRLLTVVDAAATSWGIKVTRIEIKDIVPPADLIASMGRQMKAEREKRAVILEAEGQQRAEILRADGRKQAQVLEAEGRKEAAFRDAEARERAAQAEAAATQVVSEALSHGNVAALNYFIADKYVKAMQAMATAPNQKVMVLPMEATALIGSLAGIGEIAKATFGDAASPARRAGSGVPRTGQD